MSFITVLVACTKKPVQEMLGFGLVQNITHRTNEISGADPGFFQRGGCNFENSRQTFQGQGNWGRERMGMGKG